MPNVSRCHARFAAGLLIAELVAGLSLRVLFPKPGARIVASETDGFLMEIFVDGMDRTRRDCGEWTMSIVEGDTELFASREALCSCFEPDEHDDMLMSSCIIKSVFRRPSSATPSMEISLLDASGRELASTTSTHQVLVRSAAMLAREVSAPLRLQPRCHGPRPAHRLARRPRPEALPGSANLCVRPLGHV